MNAGPVDLDPPRWPGGPRICPVANLPAFDCWEGAVEFMESHCGDYCLRWKCESCGCWHYWHKPKTHNYTPPRSLLQLLNLLWVIPDSESDPIAAIRHRAHKTNRTERFYSDQLIEDKIGSKAELAFAKSFHLTIDRNAYLHGDDCVDFILHGKTVDVKGHRKANNLLVKEKDARRCSDLLVLAEVSGDDVLFLGWTTKEIITSCPVRDFGFGIRNHYLPAPQLNPMHELQELLR